MTDCLLIGYNSGHFDEYVETLRAAGSQSPSYRDANLAFVEHESRPWTGMDLLNAHSDLCRPGTPALHNADFLWPAITYLATFLERRGYSWDYIKTFQSHKEQLRHKLETTEYLTVAITTTVYVTPQPIQEVIAFVRRYAPQTRIVIGGPYLADQPKLLAPKEFATLLKLLGADYYIFSSEGELTLTRLLDCIKRGGGFELVPNLAYRAPDGSFVVTATEIERNALVENPVDYTLFPPDAYGRFVSIRTAKSCPFACEFCGFPERAGDYTYLDTTLVERELEAIKRLGTVDTITFIDDTFNVPKKRFKEILRMMIRRGFKFRWNSYLRADHVDDEAIALMRDSGCDGVFLGAESGSPDIMQRMNKAARPHHYYKAIESCRSAGIVTYMSLIIGFPGETEASVQETMDFVEEARPDFFRAQCWYADPITPVFRHQEEHGIVGKGFQWSHRTMDVHTACHLVDRMALSVQNSVWLPQNDFELWSVFYLQRKGMPLARIKDFLRWFNAAVRHKLLNPHERMVPEKLWAPLVAATRVQPVEEEPTPYQGVEFRRGRAYWQQLFRDHPSGSVLEIVSRGVSKGPPVWRSVAIRWSPSSQPVVAAVVALTTLIARISGCAYIAVLCAELYENGTRVFPVLVRPNLEASVQALLASVAGAVGLGREHHWSANYALGNEGELRLARMRRPTIELAVLHPARDYSPEDISATLSRLVPSLAADVKLALLIDAEHAYLAYDATALRHVDMLELASGLGGLSANSDAALSEPDGAHSSRPPSSHLPEDFVFG